MNKRLAKLKNIQEANISLQRRSLKENEFGLDDLFSPKKKFDMEEEDDFPLYPEEMLSSDENNESPKSVHDTEYLNMNESSSKRKCLSCGKKR